ncbi:hypothetical protein AX15_003154 [Amanita polypyramis BW_CC]|nr:hypothetical protein AX15_003154 [Amanita polypyramis BW_CC]
MTHTSRYSPPSPEQIIMVDERPTFSRQSINDKVIFPIRKSVRAAPQPQWNSTFLENVYAMFNRVYATWAGTNEEERQQQTISPTPSDIPNGSSPSSVVLESIVHERDRYESWPFIGTASAYDLRPYISEDEGEESTGDVRESV